MSYPSFAQIPQRLSISSKMKVKIPYVVSKPYALWLSILSLTTSSTLPLSDSALLTLNSWSFLHNAKYSLFLRILDSLFLLPGTHFPHIWLGHSLIFFKLLPRCNSINKILQWLSFPLHFILFLFLHNYYHPIYYINCIYEYT